MSGNKRRVKIQKKEHLAFFSVPVVNFRLLQTENLFENNRFALAGKQSLSISQKKKKK